MLNLPSWIVKKQLEKTRKTRMIKFNPIFSYEIYLVPGALESIKKAKGFKKWSELAEALCITRQYMSNLKTGHASVSHTLIVRIAVLLNNIQDKWWVFYEIKPTHRVLRPNSPVFNTENYEGKIPYTKYSPSGNARIVDGDVEFVDN